jgi:hypothetical protein
MKQKALFVLWGGLFILCAGLGFIPQPEGFLRGLMTAAALGFFLVGWLILYRADKTGDRDSLLLVRNLSLLSLGLTLLLLVFSFLTLNVSQWMGDLVHVILVIVSSPMICSGYWALSMFLWACLLLTARSYLKKKA